MKFVGSILSVVGGIIAGSVVTGLILLLSFTVLAAPEGLNLFDAKGVTGNADKFATANFVGTRLIKGWTSGPVIAR